MYLLSAHFLLFEPDINDRSCNEYEIENNNQMLMTMYIHIKQSIVDIRILTIKYHKQQ